MRSRLELVFVTLLRSQAAGLILWEGPGVDGDATADADIKIGRARLWRLRNQGGPRL
jgi:hypothetical protein